MTDLSQDCFSRSPSSSSKGAQADPDATDLGNDGDDDAPTTQRGRHV